MDDPEKTKKFLSNVIDIFSVFYGIEWRGRGDTDCVEITASFSLVATNVSKVFSVSIFTIKYHFVWRKI
jgi:hypothetical protein